MLLDQVPNNARLFATGQVESLRITRCIDGSPGEGTSLVPAVELAVRDVGSGALHMRVIPHWRVNDIKAGQDVHMYVTRRGWASHIQTWHVLPALSARE